MKKEEKKNFTLFSHENLEVKNKLIEYARSLRDGKNAGDHLACALIYVSLDEYIAEHLLENLQQLMYQFTYQHFAGILFVDERDKEKKTLGQTVRYLEKYSFPDKEEIIKLLKQVTLCRNNLFHNLAKAGPDEFKKFDADLESIKDLSEKLISKINTVYSGLQRIIIPPPGNAEQSKAESK